MLGIETSCDETGVGIVRGHTLLADAVAVIVDEHARFGGVVPEVASPGAPRGDGADDRAGLRDGRRSRLRDVDAIAVTSGPGLAGALLVGVAAAKALAIGLGKPLYGVNHLAAHVAVDQLEHGPLPEPCLAMLVSGGHSVAAAGRGRDRRRRAAGRDHRRRGRGGLRQGGPAARAAVPGRPAHRPGRGVAARVAIDFPRGLTSRRDLERHRFDFSFSGLKTAVARWVEAQRARRRAGPRRRRRRVVPGGGLRRADPQGPRRRGDPRRSRTSSSAAASRPTRRLRAMAEERAAADGHPGAGAAPGPVHRQRRDGRRAGSRAGRSAVERRRPSTSPPTRPSPSPPSSPEPGSQSSTPVPADSSPSQSCS